MVILSSPIVLRAQSTFANLNFENPILPLDPNDPFGVPIANALPGWTGYIGSNQTDRVFYNGISIGAPAISLQGPGSLQPVLQGSYSVLLQGSTAGVPASAAMGQTGRTPQDARSIVFFAQALFSFQVTFDGHYIPPVLLETTPNYLIIAGDISTFAGQSGELRFTAAPQYFASLDNIFFSIQPIPEPSTFCLFGLGALLLRWRFLCKRP